MKKLTLAISLLATTALMAQRVGINTENPKATLDVIGNATETEKLDGIIAPRITGEQLRSKTYTTDQTGAFVYVTLADTAPAGQTINVKSIGYYYFDGEVWVKYASINDIANPSTNNYWGLTGNAGTTLGTNFLGTTDNIPLQIRVNNQHAGIISNFISNTSTPTGGNVALGHNAMPYAGKTLHTNGSPLFRQNVAIGWNSMTSDPTGSVVQNVAIGDRTMMSLTRGGTNIAIGNQSMSNANNADSNIAIGVGALKSLNNEQNSWGNITLGYRVAENMKQGRNNVFLKNFTAINGQGDNFQQGENNIFIGKDAGYGVINGNNNLAIGAGTHLNNESNRINIMNTFYATNINSNSNKIGIGYNMSAPSSTLQVGGSFSAPIDTFKGTVSEKHHTILGTGNITLPTPNGIKGRMYIFIYDGTDYTVTGDIRNFGQNITSYNINTNNKKLVLQSNDTAWIIIDN